MEAKDILFRCSGLGLIMSEPQSKADKDAGNLGETVKTHLVDIYVSNMYNRFTEINSSILSKGNEVEEDAITTVSRKLKKVFKKNEKHLSNSYIKGTPDLFEGESIEKADVIRDTKSSWNAFTFFRAKNKALIKNYYWQGQGYMELTGAKTCFFDYCLINTPYHIVEGELRRESYNHAEGNTPSWVELQIIANHVYDLKTFDEYSQRRGIFDIDDNCRYIRAGFVEIPLADRHFSIEIKYDAEAIEKLYKRIEKCKEYLETNF